MLLKVGELAKRSGMTVRMLHHFDAIDLLKPSARSEAGYRLYDGDDIGRLHAIQALRQTGLSLREIGDLLQQGQEPLPLIIERQISVLEREIEQAAELRERLRLLKSTLADGKAPDMDEWLSMLSSMSAYGKHFKASEIKDIMQRWRQMCAKWLPLVADVRDAMREKLRPDALEVQPLARRWMDLTARWMKGDPELMRRWQEMYLQEPAAQGRHGIDLEMVIYIDKAVAIRMKALLKYFTQEDLRSFNLETDDDWHALAERVGKLVRSRAGPSSGKAQEAVDAWSMLLDRTVGHDMARREKFLRAFGTDPVLRAGSVFAPELSDFIRAALAVRLGSR
ncbi:MAG TPA: MerR family transcriptional regulator [Burkholderiaceae bacterium]